MTETIKTATKAIWSLVLGILGLMGCCCLTGIPAIILGHKAKNEIQNSNGTLNGEGMALAGLIMGYISLALSIIIIPVWAAIAIPSFTNIRGESQKSACQNGQRMVRAAVEMWALEANKQDAEATDEAAVLKFLKNETFPTCPAHNLPIAVPANVGEPTVCPDPEFSEAHSLP